MSVSARDITTLLAAETWGRDKEDELFRLIEEQFRRIAESRMGRERGYHTLQGTVLVTDAFRKLVSARNVTWADRREFYGAAARVMQQLLIDHDRRRKAQKRGSGEKPVDLDKADVDRRAVDPQDQAALGELLEKLAREHPDWHQVFMLHHYGRWNHEEIATEILSVSVSTARRRWDLARAYLRKLMMVDD